jgi:hypothetical protein
MNWCQNKITVYVKITVCKYCLSAPRFENFMSKETCTHKKKEEKFWLSTNRNFNTSNKCQSYRIINTVWCYNFNFLSDIGSVAHLGIFEILQNCTHDDRKVWQISTSGMFKKKKKYRQISIVYVVKSVFYIS